MCGLYLINPVVEGGHAGEDGGLLLVVAAQARDETGDSVHLPGTLHVLTVQRTARVSLRCKTTCFILLMVTGRLTRTGSKLTGKMGLMTSEKIK